MKSNKALVEIRKFSALSKSKSFYKPKWSIGAGAYLGFL